MEVGIDAVDVARIRSLYLQYGDRFLRRVFTQTEIDYAFSARDDRRYERLAGRFALKEALIKAYGHGIPFREIEVRHNPAGKPVVVCGRVRGKIMASLTHTRRLAVACILVDPDPTSASHPPAE